MYVYITTYLCRFSSTCERLGAECAVSSQSLDIDCPLRGDDEPLIKSILCQRKFDSTPVVNRPVDSDVDDGRSPKCAFERWRNARCA